MEPSKFSARIKLWLSKTEEVATVDSVRWVPDITPRTLRISVEAMQTVKETLGIHHVPSKSTSVEFEYEPPDPV